MIDTARGEIFAVADVLSGGTPAHVRAGLNIYTGSSMLAGGSTPRVNPRQRSCSAPG